MLVGPRFVRIYVMSHLADDLPSRIENYRRAWRLDVDELPEPRHLLSYEPFGVDDFPTVYSVIGAGQSTKRLDYEDEGPLFETLYVCRVYSWVISDDAKKLNDSRDNLCSVIKESLISVPSLSSDNCNAWLNEASVTEQFGNMEPGKGDRVVSASFVEFDVRVLENVPPVLEDFGRVAETSLEIERLADLFDVTPTAVSGLQAVFRYARDESGGSYDEDAVVLGFVEPVWDGGFSIARYEVSYREQDSDSVVLVQSDNVTFVGRTLAVTGVPPGTYVFQVRAGNSAGFGPWSEDSNAVVVAA